MATIRMFGGCLNDDELWVQCDIEHAGARVFTNYHQYEAEWQPTKYSAIDCPQRTARGLAWVGQRIAERLNPYVDLEEVGRCMWEEVLCQTGRCNGDEMTGWTADGTPACAACLETESRRSENVESV